MIPNVEDCKPGFRPTRYNMIVALDFTPEKIGGIFLPEQHRNREDSAAEKGRVISVSPMAFQGGDWEMESAKPTTGDIVLFQRYAGNEIEGEDGKKYRVIADDDVKGIYHG